MLVHEKLLLDDKTGPLANSLVSLDMAYATEGQQFSGSELRLMLTRVGLTNTRIRPTVGYWSVVSGEKP